MVSKGFLKPEDICKVDYDGKQLAGTRKRTSEVLLHLAVYKNRPDINAVVHCHPPHATAFAVAQEPIPKCVLPEVEVFLGEVPIAKYAPPGDQRLPIKIDDTRIHIKDCEVCGPSIFSEGYGDFAPEPYAFQRDGQEPTAYVDEPCACANPQPKAQVQVKDMDELVRIVTEKVMAALAE